MIHFSVTTSMAITSLVSFIISAFMIGLSRDLKFKRANSAYLLLAMAYASNGFRIVIQLLNAIQIIKLDVLGDIFYILFITFIWFGIRGYVDPKPFKKVFLVIPSSLSLWTLVAHATSLPMPWLALPDHCAGAVLFALSGHHLWKLHQKNTGWDFNVLAWMMWLQGLSTLTYPFNRMSGWAPYGFATLAFLGTAIGLGLMVAALRENQGQLLQEIHNREEIAHALRESEERYRTQFRLASEGIITHTFEGGLLEINESFARMHGYAPEEMLSMNLDELDHGGSFRGAEERLIRLRAGAALTFEVEHTHKDGHAFPLEVSTSVINTGGRPIVLAFHRDITERKRAEADLLKLNQDLERRVKDRTSRLEAMNRELEAFSYSVSHDLRSPLQVVTGFSEALLEDYRDRLDEGARKYLSRILTGAQRMGHLIDDLLRLARTSQGDLQVSACDLSSLCRKLAGDLVELAPERGIEASVQPGMWVQADPRLMRVALENLLGNAWKFSAKAERPRVEAGETVTPGGERAFYIRDNGAGFDMGQAGKLFNPFQRLHSSAEFEGTGIGLAIVQRIIHRHGGRIWAEAEPGRGATFFFTLPARNGAHGPAAGAKA